MEIMRGFGRKVVLGLKSMEIPRNWREQPTNMRFTGERLNHRENNIYKYPGGVIPLVGSYLQIRERFIQRGFSTETVDEILFRLWSGVTTEATVSLGEVAESFFEFVGSEVGK